MVVIEVKNSSNQSPALAELLLAPSLLELQNAVATGRLTAEQFCNFWRRTATQAHLRGNSDLLRQLLQLLNQAPAHATTWGQLLSHQYNGLLLLSEGSFNRALYHFQMQRQQAAKLSDPTELALANLDLAQVALYTFNLSEVQARLEETTHWARQSGEPALVVKTLNRQAELAAYQHQTEVSLAKAQQALTLAVQHRFRLEQAFALNWLGVGRMYRRELDSSEQAFRDALRLRQTVRDTLGQAETLTNLSRLHLKRGDRLAALKAVDGSLALMQQLKNHFGIARALYHKAMLLHKEGQFEEALVWARQEVDIRTQQGEPTRLAQASSTLAQIYTSLHQPAEALACHQRVLELHRGEYVTPQWIELLVGAADYLLRTNEAEVGSAFYWRQAFSAYRAALGIIERNENLRYLAPVLGRMARALIKLNGFEALPEAMRCYRLQLSLLGDMDDSFFPINEAIAQRAEALTGLQVCASLQRRQQG